MSSSRTSAGPSLPTSPDTTVPPAGAGPFARLSRWTRPVLVVNVVAQAAIVVTGGAVRLTGSGLGCSTWPQCEPGSFTPVLHDAASFHPLIEFGNRTLTGVLGIIAIAVALLVFTDRRRRSGYRWLGLAPILGVVLQALVGGATVLLDLHPGVVAVHLLISMGLVAASTALLFREGESDGPAVRLVDARTTLVSRALVGATALVLALGVVVTGSGPHGGDDEVAFRFALDPVLVARAHSGAVWIFVGLLIALIVLLRSQGAPSRAQRAARVLLVVALAQGLIGYVQYATGLPVVLVGLHMLGAALLTATTTWTVLTLRRR